MFAALKIAWNIKKFKKAFVEVREAFSALKSLTEMYQAAKEDDQLTPQEMERLMVQVGKVVRESAEAVDVVKSIV